MRARQRSAEGGTFLAAVVEPARWLRGAVLRVADLARLAAGLAAAEVALSGTGWGEFYIRSAAAHDICARVSYRGDALAAAAEEVINGIVPKLGGDGGAIALDRHGNIAMPFNTSGMYRGWVKPDGSRGTAVFRED